MSSSTHVVLIIGCNSYLVAVWSNLLDIYIMQRQREWNWNFLEQDAAAFSFFGFKRHKDPFLQTEPTQ